MTPPVSAVCWGLTGRDKAVHLPATYRLTNHFPSPVGSETEEDAHRGLFLSGPWFAL